VELLPLNLEDFASVRSFAAAVLGKASLATAGGADGGRGSVDGSVVDVLVHGAATKEGCFTTVDGHDLATQAKEHTIQLSRLEAGLAWKCSRRPVHARWLCSPTPPTVHASPPHLPNH